MMKIKFSLPFKYQTVWNAAQIVLGSYPLVFNDIENGIVKTQLLKKESCWTAPFEKEHSNRYSQRLEFRFVKVHSQLTDLYIRKQASVTTDFLGFKKRGESPRDGKSSEYFTKSKGKSKLKKFFPKSMSPN